MICNDIIIIIITIINELFNDCKITNTTNKHNQKQKTNNQTNTKKQQKTNTNKQTQTNLNKQTQTSTNKHKTNKQTNISFS